MVDPEHEQLVLHEAGHAVVAVALGFELRSVVLRGEESSTFLHIVDGWIGETNSTAADVTSRHPDMTLKYRSAIVAMAGREGRRLKYPEADAAARPFDEDDRLKALALLRSISEGQSALLPPDSELLAPVAEEAKQLVLQHRDAVDNLAALLLARGLPARVTGAEALATIRGGRHL